VTVSEIIAAVQLQAGLVYDDPTWISFINLALDDLTPTAKVLKKKEDITVTLTEGKGTIDITADTDLKQAHEFLSVYTSTEMLRRLPITDNVSKGWKLLTGKIDLQGLTGASVTCRVDYYQRLKHVSTLADDIETVSYLPAQYHPTVILYCAAKSQQERRRVKTIRTTFIMSIYSVSVKWLLTVFGKWNLHLRKFIKRARIAQLIGAQTEGR